MAVWKKQMLSVAGAAGGGPAYWISEVQYGVYYNVAVDSSDNIIAVGWDRYNDFLVVKYNKFGTQQWATLLDGSGNDRAWDVAVDSSDNIIVVGQTSSDGAGGTDCLVAKFNSSGVLQWDRTFGGTSTEYYRGVTIDGGDNIIATGITLSDGSGDYDCLTVKYEADGTLVWRRTLGGSSREFGENVCVDSLNNVYVAGRCDSDGAGGRDLFVAKYNSSGTLQWARTLGGTGNDQAQDITIDSSGDLVITGIQRDVNDNYLWVVKYNTSGTFQWDKRLGASSSPNEQGYGLTTDSSDNIYAVGKTASSDWLIAKYNSSGTFQWDKTISASGAYGIMFDAAIDSNDDLIVVGYNGGVSPSEMLIAKLPNDGSGGGTYGDYTYGDVSLVSEDVTLTEAAAVLTDAQAVLTDAAAVLTETSASLTTTQYEIT